jgi:hypothetical protein
MMASVVKTRRKPAGSRGGEVQRPAGGVGEPGAGERVADQDSDAADGDRPVLQAVRALEQQRHRRVPDLFVVVVGAHERDAAVGIADPADDRGQHVGQLRRDDQQSFLVGFARRDLQQRHQLPGGRWPVLDQAVVGQLGQLLDPDPGGAQHLNRRPRPERAVLLAGQVATPSGRRLLGPDAGRVASQPGSLQRDAVDGERLAGLGVLGQLQARGRGVAVVVDGLDKDRQGALAEAHVQLAERAAGEVHVGAVQQRGLLRAQPGVIQRP